MFSALSRNSSLYRAYCLVLGRDLVFVTLELVPMPLDPFNCVGDYELGLVAIEDDQAPD